MANRTGQGMSMPQVNRQVGTSGDIPRIQYSTTGSVSPEAGRGLQVLGDILQKSSMRVEDRLDVIAADEASKAGTMAGMRPGSLPNKQAVDTIRGRYFNAAAVDAVETRLELESRQKITELENQYKSDPQTFKQKADAYIKGFSGQLLQFDPKLAQGISTSIQLRTDDAFQRVKSRQEAVIRDQNIEQSLRLNQHINDENALISDKLFNHSAEDVEAGLAKLAANYGTLYKASQQIGPDGHPLFSATQRVAMERQAQVGFVRDVSLAWLRTQDDTGAALEQLKNGQARFEAVDVTTGKAKTIDLSEAIDPVIMNVAFEGIMDEGLRERAQKDLFSRQRIETETSGYELKIEAATNPADLAAMDREIEASPEKFGGVPEANTLRRKIMVKTRDYREKQESAARGGAFATGRVYLNPQNDQAVRDFNNYYDAVQAPRLAELPADVRNTALTQLVDKARVIPKSLKGDIEAASRSRKVEEVTAAADLLDRISSINPNLLSEIPEKDQARMNMISSYVDAGYPSEEAMKKADEMMAPKNASIVEARMNELKAAKIDYKSLSIDVFNPGIMEKLFALSSTPDPDNPAPTPSQSLQLENDYRRAFDAHYQITGDLNLSEKHANKVIGGLYGRSTINGTTQIMKYAPEKFYTIPNHDNDWMRKQMINAAKEASAPDKVWRRPDFDAEKDVILVPDPYVTPRTAKAGAPAYKLMMIDREDGSLRNFLPSGQYFTFDPDAENDRLINKARKEAGEVR